MGIVSICLCFPQPYNCKQETEYIKINEYIYKCVYVYVHVYIYIKLRKKMKNLVAINLFKINFE